MSAVLYSSRRQADGSIKVNGAVEGVAKVVVVPEAPEDFSVDDAIAALEGSYRAPSRARARSAEGDPLDGTVAEVKAWADGVTVPAELEAAKSREERRDNPRKGVIDALDARRTELETEQRAVTEPGRQGG